HVGFLPAQRLEQRTVGGLSQTRAYELITFRVAAAPAHEPAVVEPGQGLGHTLEGEDSRPDEQQKADERRGRIAGQAEAACPAAGRRGVGVAGLDRAPPETLLNSELGLDSTHEIVGAHGDATRGDDEICLERLLEGASMRGFLIAHSAQRFDDRSYRLE